MTNQQALRADLLARLDELYQMTEYTTDRDILINIAERKKEIREALDKLTDHQGLTTSGQFAPASDLIIPQHEKRKGSS